MKRLLASAILISSVSAVAAPEVNWGGRVEAEYSNSESYSEKVKNDITNAMAEIHVDAKMNDKTSGKISILFEEGVTAFSLDNAYISRKTGNVTVSAGKMFLPFAYHSTHFVSDSLVTTLAENTESAIRLDWDSGKVNLVGYVYNGTQPHANGKDYAHDYGIGFNWKNDSYKFGLGYTNNFLNGLFINDQNADGTPDQTYTKDVASGTVVSFDGTFGAINFKAEHFTSSKFNEADKTFDGKAAQISATVAEVGYSVNADLVVALGHQMSAQALSYGLPKSKSLVGVNYTLDEVSGLLFEVNQASDYETKVGGTGKDSTGLHAKWTLDI